MNKYKEMIRRISAVLLALMICITFMPAGVFAQDEQQSSDVSVEEQEPAAEEPAAEEPADEEPVVEEPVVEEPVREDPADEEPVVEKPENRQPSKNADGNDDCRHPNRRHYDAKSPTCKDKGNIEYYYCPDCGQYFLDQGCQQTATWSEIEIPADPNAHVWDSGKITKEPKPRSPGVKTYTCTICGKTKTEQVKYVPATGTSFKLDGVKVKFKKPVVKKPERYYKNITPGRVWIKGKTKKIKVSWKNAKNMGPVDGVFILRKTGSSKVYEEVKKVKFRTKKDGKTVVNVKTSYTDKTAKKKNTEYTYRVISYYELDGYTYLSDISEDDWAKGVTGNSKLKNVYSGKINAKKATLQSGSKKTLKVTVSNPKKKFKPNSRRWFSSNKNVATVSSKGKVTAKAPGTATIRCRLASGYEVTSKITVVGAFTPSAPTLKVDYATTNKIQLIWNSVKYATSYEVYKSNDGLHWDKDPKVTTKTTTAFTGLKKGHRYTFYCIARNVNKNGLDKDGNKKTYKAYSTNSNVINQKAVLRLRPTSVSGWPTSKSETAGNTIKVTVKVAYPEARTASLQMKSGKKWTTKKTIKLPKGTGTSSVSITFPNDWWNGQTQWRLFIPKNKTAKEYTTKTLKITAKRRYQNPSSYVQIQDSISKHGYSHYVSPVLVNASSYKSDHVEALIKTAKKYMGNRYVQSKSGAPGKGIDESGLVMQACYGAGVDLWPISPSTRPYNCVPDIMNSRLKKITYKQAAEGSNDYVGMYRGDLVFFASTKGGTPIHVAIYTGLGGIIHADPVKGNVNSSTIRTLEDPEGPYQYYVVGVRRIFN